MRKNKTVFRLRDHTGEYAVNKRRFALKLVGCVIALVIAYGLFYSMMNRGLDKAKYESEAYYTGLAENDRIERRFSDLYGTLTLYKLTDDVYDPYWEIADGYLDYTIYRAYADLEDSDEIIIDIATEDDEEKELVIRARENADAYRKKVQENAKNCAFPENQSYLNQFAGK